MPLDAHDDEPTAIEPRTHKCCGEIVTMQELVFGEHICHRTMRCVATVVRNLLEEKTHDEE